MLFFSFIYLISSTIVLGLLVSLHYSIGIPFPDETQHPGETPASSVPYPEPSHFKPLESKRPKNEPIYLPYSPEQIKEYFSEGRLAAAAVHNVNLRELFKPLLAASDSSRLTNYIDSVINKFNMRSKKTPPVPQEKPIMKDDVQVSLDAGLEKFKKTFKNEKSELKKEVKLKTELTTSSPSTPKPKLNFKENVMNKTDAILEKLGIVRKRPVAKEEPSKPSTEPPIDNAITLYPHEVYSNLKKLHDSATKASTQTDEQNNGSTKSALFEIEIPFYYPEARMPSLKHIAGATALGALALGAIFASPLGTGLLRRYDTEHTRSEDEENWLDSFSFWKKDNDSYEERDQYNIYNTFHDLYNPYYPETADVYSETYDDDSHPSEKNYENYGQQKSNYDKQNDYANDWHSNHNYNVQPYQYVIPAEPVASVSYGTKPGYNYYQQPFDSKVRAALSIPTAYETSEPQSFSVGDSYIVQDEPHPSLVNERKDYYDYYDQNYGASEKNRYVTVEEVNKIAEESLKQILKNYKTYLSKDIQEAITDSNPAESSYSSFTAADYQTEWEPKRKIYQAYASPKEIST
ncbi:hypothetical protein Avbf_06286 [Armadillidium vulgare]|nr:hypothetical protein Avbf_06286 [Armadillidium vulgare]